MPPFGRASHVSFEGTHTGRRFMGCDYRVGTDLDSIISFFYLNFYQTEFS
jgi:hypothetical protein